MTKVNKLFDEFERGVKKAMEGRDTLSRNYDWPEFFDLCKKVFLKALNKGGNEKLLGSDKKEIKNPFAWGSSVATKIWLTLGRDKIFPKIDLNDLIYELSVNTKDLDEKYHFEGLKGDRFYTKYPPKESEAEILLNLRAEAWQIAEYLYKRLRYDDNSGLRNSEIFDWLKRQKLVQDGKPNKQALLLYLLWSTLRNDKVFVYLANLFAGHTIKFPSHMELEKTRRNILLTEWKKLTLKEKRVLEEAEYEYHDVLTKTPKLNVIGIKDNKALVERKITKVVDGKEIAATEIEEVPLDSDGIFDFFTFPGKPKPQKVKRKESKFTDEELGKLTKLDRSSVVRIIKEENEFCENLLKEKKKFDKLFEGFEDAEVVDVWVDLETGTEVETVFDQNTGHTSLKETGEIIHYGTEVDENEDIVIRKPNLRYERKQIVIRNESAEDLIKTVSDRKRFRKKLGISNLASGVLSMLLYNTETFFNKERVWRLNEHLQNFIEENPPSPGQEVLLAETAKEVFKKAIEDMGRREYQKERKKEDNKYSESIKAEALKSASNKQENEQQTIAENLGRDGLVIDREADEYALIQKKVVKKSPKKN